MTNIVTISPGNGLPVPVLLDDVMTDQDWQQFQIFRSPDDGQWYASARTPILSNGKSYCVAVPVYRDTENTLRSMMTKAFNKRKLNNNETT